MARWKSRIWLPIRHNWTFFAISYRWGATSQTCQDSLLSGEGGSLCAKISGGRGRPLGILFGFYKTRHILLSDSAKCTVLRAVVLTQYRHVTDRQTDGIAVASTALAMRALRRAVKKFGYGTLIVASVVNLVRPTTVASLSHRASTFVYNNARMTQRIARVRLRQTRLVKSVAVITSWCKSAVTSQRVVEHHNNAGYYDSGPFTSTQ